MRVGDGFDVGDEDEGGVASEHCAWPVVSGNDSEGGDGFVGGLTRC